MSVPGGGEVQRLAVRRPVGPFFRVQLRDRNPGAFRNRFRSIDGRDRDASTIWFSPNRKTDPAIVGREPAVQQRVNGMHQQGGLLMRGQVENIDLVWIAAKHEYRLLVTGPVRSLQASFAQLLRCAAGSGYV